MSTPGESHAQNPFTSSTVESLVRDQTDPDAQRKVAFKGLESDTAVSSSNNPFEPELVFQDERSIQKETSSRSGLVEESSGLPSMQDRALEFDGVDTKNGVEETTRRGWIIAFSAFLTNVILIGAHNCFGLLFIDLVQEFHEPLFKTAWIGSIDFGCLLVFAPLSGFLSQRYGSRKVSIAGVWIASLSLLASSFVQYTDLMDFTYGVMFGMGSSFTYTQGPVMISRYFSSSAHHALASGIVLTGSSLGTLIMAPVYNALNAKYGWRWVLRIFAGLIFCTTGLVATYKPLAEKPGRSGPSTAAVKQVVELSLWKNKAFLVWCCAVGLCKIGYLVPWVHLVNLAKDIGLGREFGSSLLLTMGIAASVSRLTAGFAADSKYVNRLYLSQFCAFSMGLLNMITPSILSKNGLLAYVITLGILDGGVEILLPVLTLELVGSQKLSVAWGCILAVISLSCLGPPVVGAMRDQSGMYNNMFYFSGVPMILSSFVIAIIPLWAKKQPQVPQMSILSVDPSKLQDAGLKNEILTSM